MTATVATPVTAPPRASSGVRRVKGRRNYLGGFFGWVWLAIIIIPIYYVVITSGLYYLNTVIVTVGAVLPIVLFSFLASYAIVRGDSRLLRFSRTLFLLGLAIPLQATIVPIYLIITRIQMYDSLGALILPSIAFGIPLTVLILSNFIRDVPRELFESMRLDGCTDWQMAWRLAFPLTRPAIVTVSIYNGLHVWNAFLFALILTQSPEKRVMPLALWAFQGEYTVNIPAVLAAVVLSTLPILVLYVVGRRQLLRGLTAGFGK